MPDSSPTQSPDLSVGAWGRAVAFGALYPLVALGPALYVVTPEPAVTLVWFFAVVWFWWLGVPLGILCSGLVVSVLHSAARSLSGWQLQLLACLLGLLAGLLCSLVFIAIYVPPDASDSVFRNLRDFLVLPGALVGLSAGALLPLVAGIRPGRGKRKSA